MLIVVAELVRLRRAARLDARRELARIVSAEAAPAGRSEKVAERAGVAEEIKALVGYLEARRRRLRAGHRRPGLPVTAGAHADIPLLGHLLDDLLDELFEPRLTLRLVGVRRVAQELLHGLFRQQAAVQERIEDRVVERLDGLVAVLVIIRGCQRVAVRVVEAAREKQLGELGDELLEVDAAEGLTGIPGVAIAHDGSRRS